MYFVDFAVAISELAQRDPVGLHPFHIVCYSPIGLLVFLDILQLVYCTFHCFTDTMFRVWVNDSSHSGADMVSLNLELPLNKYMCVDQLVEPEI